MGSFVTLFNYIGYRLMLSLACQSGRGWLIIAGLFDRYMELTQSRNHDHPLWTRSGDVVFDGGYAVWFTDDLIQLAVADLCRNVTLQPDSSQPTPLPAAGSAPAQNALKARPPRCICSVTIWGRVLPGRWVVFSGITMAGTASAHLLL